jgi:hypothetical protein
MKTLDIGRFTFPASRVAFRAFKTGVREFRDCYTKAYKSERLRNCYDTGREFAHNATFRRWDN